MICLRGKGLVAFAKLNGEPGLLILDEPTNHSFRHIPIIAEALNSIRAMILVSHVPEFVEQIRIDDVLDLDKKKKEIKKQ